MNFAGKFAYVAALTVMMLLCGLVSGLCGRWAYFPNITPLDAVMGMMTTDTINSATTGMVTMITATPLTLINREH